MKGIVRKGRCVGLLLMLLAAFCFLGVTKEVSADTRYKVTFANEKGDSSYGNYKKWTRSVKAGTTIALPKITRSGYQVKWVTTVLGKQYRYSPGQKVSIDRNMKFCLKTYKLYTVRFYTANGKNEYRNLRKTVTYGSRIKLPSGFSNENYQFAGWSSKANGSVKYKAGTYGRVKANIKFYAVTQKSSGVKLYKNDGSYWKTIAVSKDKKTVFPAATTGNGDMVLGWSRRKGKTSNPEYFTGDTIPNTSAKYYMVVFPQSKDTASATRATQKKYDFVYFVGDSRTAGMNTALNGKGQKPQAMKFIYRAGQGLQWFKSTGFSQLYTDVKSRPKTEKKAVIINLGVNDLQSTAAYVKYMKAVAQKLKAYNCTMYYMSVNPLNTAMITRYRGQSQGAKTEAKVQAFNKYIYSNLCYGRNGTYNYINTWASLRKNGWISSKNNTNTFDGLHYSNETYLRIYDYCMRVLNR